MNRTQFEQAIELAISGSACMHNIHAFLGFGLKDFNPIVCQLCDIAGLVVWQCFKLNGSLDLEALNEIWDNRRKFKIV